MKNTAPHSYAVPLIACFLLGVLLFNGLNVNAQCSSSTLDASFSVANSHLCTNSNSNSFTLTNTSTGSANTSASYKWYLGIPSMATQVGSTTGMTAPPSVPTTGDGEEYFYLVAFDPATSCYDTAKVRISISKPPTANFTFTPNSACAGSTISFTNTSTQTYSYTTYSWDFGDGNTSPLKDPTHVYAAEGTYNVILTISNSTGCDNTVSRVVTVVEPPVPDFTFTNDNKCAGTTLAFTNTSTATKAGTTYSWNFGDGITSTQENPTKVYAAADTYTVTLEVSNSSNCKVTSSPQVVTVTPSPVANFTFNNDNQCAGTLITFTNTSTGTVSATAYSWDFGDGSSSTSENPTHTYTAGGTYNVKLTVSNGASCTNISAPATITVKQTPVSTFTYASASCSSMDVNFTNTSNVNGPANTYLWDFGDGGSSTQENPIHTYSANGAYNVTLTITAASGCSHTSSIVKITVGNMPPALSFAMSPLTGCSPRTVTFTNTSSGAVPADNYDWDFGNGVTLTGVKDPPNQLYYAGTYTIRLISGNACGKDTLDQILNVDTLPKAILATSPLTGCIPLNFTASNNSTGNNLTYKWYENGILIATTQQIPSKTYSTASNTLQLVVTNSCGTDDTTVTITASPKVKTVISPLKSTICSASDFSFTYTQNSTGDNLTYYWDFDNGNTSTLPNPPAQTFLNGATYHPKLVVTGTCGKDSSIATLQVYQVPTAPVVADTTICIGTSVTLTATAPGGEYEWFDSPGGTLLKVGNSFKTPVLNANKTYYVQATVQDCISPLKEVRVTIKPLPPQPTVTNATICSGDSAILKANGSVGLGFEWFSTVTGGVRLDSIADFTTPVLTATTSYYVQSVMNGCASARVKATATVNPIPAAPTALPVGICTGTSATLTATAPGGNYTWHSAATGGIQLGTGATYTTSVLNADTAFYVQSEKLGCASPRKQVKVTVNPVPVADIDADIKIGCVGMDVNFTNNSTTGAAYTWNFATGNPATSSQYIPAQVKFNTPGNHLVYLKVDIGGCTKNDSVYINTGAFPKSIFTVAPLEGCSPLDVTIDNKSVASPTDSYFWDLDKERTSTDVTPPPQQYTAKGLDSVYTIKLVITTPNGCKDSSTQQISVHINPVASFNVSTNTACMNEVINFSSESLGAATWDWDFGDGGKSNLKQPAHQYAVAGIYTVKLLITGGYGCKDSVVRKVTINANPVAQYTASTNCNTFPTQFTDNSTDAVTWEWNFDDASPINTTPSPLHVFPSFGTYNVLLKVTNTLGCSDSITQAVTVLERPKADFLFNTVCAKKSIYFKDTSISGAGLTSWEWDLGDGTNATTQNTSHAYTLGDTYPVTLIVKNNLGCSDTITKQVKIGTIPVPLFKANVTCLGKITSFQDLSTDIVAINKWFYDFGDGNNSVSKDPNYIYMSSGTYNVSLTVTNVDGCDSSITLPVVVEDTPKADFVADSICLSNPTTFTDKTAGSVIQWEWDFGDGTTANVGPVTSHTYASSGSYLVSLKIVTAGNCMDEIFKKVVVRNDIQAGMAFKDSACINEIVTLTDRSSVSTGSIVTSSWNFGDGSPDVNGLDVNHTYKSSGIFVITHTVASNGGCQNQIKDTIFVGSSSKADFVSSNTCINQLSNFTDKSTGVPVAWSWDFNDGTTSTDQNPKHLFSKTGVFNVQLIVQAGSGCSDTIIKKVTIHKTPVASFTNNISCWGDTTHFLNTSNPMDGSIVKIWWNFGDGDTSDILNPNHIFSIKKDSFLVTMTIKNSFGCIDTVEQTVKTQPIPQFKYSVDATSGCNPFTITCNDSSTVNGGAIVNWLWDFGDKNMTYGKQPKHTYTQDGKFYISLTLTSTYGCRAVDTLKFPIEVYPRPVAAFVATPKETSIYEPIIQFKDWSQKATMWNWDFGDNSTSVDQFPKHTYADTGIFKVMQVAINAFGCKDTVQHLVTIKGEPTIFIPNAFTPDGNGLNDEFIPKMFGVREFKMMIHDRWGNLIFTSDDQTVGWNGRANNLGVLVEDGVYVYTIYIRNLNGNPQIYRGKVTVVKKTDRD